MKGCCLASFHTSVPVSQEVSIDIVDVGVDGGTAGHAAGGHVGVILWVDILKALPRHTGAELWCERWDFFLLAGQGDMRLSASYLESLNRKQRHQVASFHFGASLTMLHTHTHKSQAKGQTKGHTNVYLAV